MRLIIIALLMLLPHSAFAATSAVSRVSGGSGDVTAIGDCASGDCFDGTQGTQLTFYNGSGNGTITYGTAFSFSKSISLNSGSTVIGSTGSLTLASGTTSSAQLTSTTNSLTSGNAILAQSSSNSMTGKLIRSSYTGTSSGSAIEASISNASASGSAMLINNYGTGDSLLINDVSGDTTPFKVDANGDMTSPGNVTFSSTGSVGWSIQSAANQACTTTCTSAAIFGWDTSSGEVAVSASDATADKCLCAGPS